MNIKGTSPNEEKDIAIFKKLSDGYKIYSIDGYETLTNDEFKEIKSKPRSSKYLLVKHKVCNDSLKQQYKDFINRADEIKEVTNNKINLYKTGSDAKTALTLFNRYMIKDKIAYPENIQSFETDIFEKCKLGGMRYNKPYEGTAYKYDICSQYPSILQSTHFSIPIATGELKTLTNKEFNKMKYFSYGIYNVKVIDADFRLFKSNDTNWYTHIDLNLAMKLGYKLILIEKENNFLDYANKTMNSYKIFGKYINYLFKFKSEGYKWSKTYINVLWGALCQTNLMTVKTAYEDDVILTITPSNDDQTNLTFDVVKSMSEYYENNYARLKPFLVAKARAMVANILQNHKEHLVYTHTDGFVLTKKLDIKTGNNIGDVKYEGKSKNCIVKNGNSCKGDFVV